MINFFTPINDLGMGRHAYGMMKALDERGRELCFFPPFGNVKSVDERIRRWLDNRIRFSTGDLSVMIFDMGFLAQFAGNPRVAFAVFETDWIDPLHVHLLEQCDIVLTPSDWGRLVLASYGVKGLVVPEGYDPEEIPEPFPSRIEAGSRFAFGHVGKFEERKGTLQVIRCFFNALERQEADLVMHVHNPFVSDFSPIEYELNKFGFSSPDGQAWRRLGLRILFTAARETMAGYWSEIDCGLFPSKGEGWGLPILECIASGVPAITGNWTGQSEYLARDYPRELVLDGRIKPASDGVWFHGQGNWFSVPDECLVERIRWAHAHAREFRAGDGWIGEVRRIRGFTWDAAAARFEGVFVGP